MAVNKPPAKRGRPKSAQTLEREKTEAWLKNLPAHIQGQRKIKHGEETLEAKAGRSEKSVMFRYLTDIGDHCNMFYTQLKTRGGPPSGYTQLSLSDPEQLALTILKTLPK